MPAVLEVFAERRPRTFMVNAGRGLLLGDAATATFEHGLSYYVAGSLLWSLALAPGLRAAGDPAGLPQMT